MGITQESIKQALTTVQSCGCTISEKITHEVEALDNPVFRVAVVGKFQVGKSTLINRLFLGGDSLLGLSEGNGFRCETSVVTDVAYGATPKLEVYNWSSDGGEELSVSKDNPTAEDIRAATVADSERKRTELAANVSRVKLVTPNESLKGYVLLDTPGLDDPNKSLLFNTTYRIVPSVDLALLVVEPKQIDEVVDDFLRKTLIEQGVKRLMVLVSYNPNEGELDGEQRRDVVEMIEAQLARLGRADVPVVMYCYDPSVDDIISDVSELRLTIRQFLNENALPGRLERVAYVVRQYLEDIELEIAAKIRACGSSEAEKAELKAKVDEQIAIFKEQCEKSFGILRQEFDDLECDVSRRVNRAVDSSFFAYVQKLEVAPDLNDIRRLCDAAGVNELRNDLEESVIAVDRKIRSDIEAIVTRYTQNLSDTFSAWNRFLLEDFGIKRPLLAKIPTFAWFVVDVCIYNFFLPMGWMTALVGRLIGGKIKISMSTLVKPLLLHQVKGELEKARGQVCEQVSEQMSAHVDGAFAQVKEEIEKNNRLQVERMQKAVGTEESDSVRADLEQVKSTVSAAIESLQ